jgi:S-adenosylmethionine decarboxylase
VSILTRAPAAGAGAPREPGTVFLIQAIVWIAGLFALIRLPWVDAHVVRALVAFQTTLVAWYGTPPAGGVLITSSCSGADAAALCLGITLAYPVAWRRRLTGSAIGLVLVFVANALRIASLYAAAASPARLDFLHVYVWPTVLAGLVLAYVSAWIRWNVHGTGRPGGAWVRFTRISFAAFIAYAAAVPWAFTSAWLSRAGEWTAASAAWTLGRFGAETQAAGAMLFTSRGAFAMTPECLFTPVLPLFVGAVCAMPMPRARRALWLALAPLIFFLLGVARLLALALPRFVVDRPAIVVHGFYQIVAGAAVIAAAAFYATAADRDRAARGRRLTIAIAIAAAAGVLLGAPWRLGVEALARGVSAPFNAGLIALSTARDGQGALAVLPAYQLALTCGLWFAIGAGAARRRLAWTLPSLAPSQAAFIVAISAIDAWSGRTVPALVIRAWGIGLPALIGFVWAAAARAAADEPSSDRYSAGIEYVVDAQGCDPAVLRSLESLRRLSDEVIRGLNLRPVAAPFWYVLHGGSEVAGLTLLSESHLSIHAYPDERLAVINLYCCRPRADWPWEPRLAAALGARQVSVRVVTRGAIR